MSILQTIAFIISAGSTITDRDGFNKRKEDNNLRLSKLSAQERYDEKHRKYLKNLSR